MAQFMAVTGPIASGKSTATELLKTFNYDIFPMRLFQQIKFVYLDQYLKSGAPELKELETQKKEIFIKYLGKEDPTNSDISAGILDNRDIRKEYLELFVKPLEGLLEGLSEYPGPVVVEASTLFAFPSLFKYFSVVVELSASATVRTRNLKCRGMALEDCSLFDRLQRTYALDNRNSYAGQFHGYVQFKGTLQELRSMIGASFVKYLRIWNGADIHWDYLDLCVSHIDAQQQETPSLWHPEVIRDDFHNRKLSINRLVYLALSGMLTNETAMAIRYLDIGHDPREGYDRRADSDLYVLVNKNDAVMEMVLDARRALVGVPMFPAATHVPEILPAVLSDFMVDARDVLDAEDLLFKEKAVLSYSSYLEERLYQLRYLLEVVEREDPRLAFGRQIVAENLRLAIDYCKNRKPRIAWFCGSFNPFTIGHQDILDKASKMFDKVVLVQAVHPDKGPSTPLTSSNHQVISSPLPIPRLLKNESYIPTLILGVRNYADLVDAQAWHLQIKEFYPDVELCLIPGDPALVHVSSSFVRAAEKARLETKKLVRKP